MTGSSLRVVSFALSGDTREFGPSAARIAQTASDVTDQLLKNSISRFVEAMQGILEDLPATGAFVVRSFQVQAQITAEGGIELIGSLSAGVTGGVTITFERGDK